MRQKMLVLCPDENVHPTDFFRQGFINKMPVGIQELLAVQDELDMAELARLADKMVGNMQANFLAVNEVSENKTESIIAWTSKSISNTTKDKSKGEKRHLCFLHSKYGKDAMRCEAPCDWVTYAEYKYWFKSRQVGNARGNQE
jgi:hypothetical protein